jgi:lysyl-tRNA synthetase class I
MNNANANDANSDAMKLFKRDAHLNQLKNKLEENRKKMLGNRLLLKQTSKTNPHLDGLVKMYDEYYNTFKTNIKLQISALERIVKHLNEMMEKNVEEYVEDAEDAEDDIDINSNSGNIDIKNMTHQLKNDKKMMMKEIQTLKKLLLSS